MKDKKNNNRLFIIEPNGLPDLAGMMLAVIRALKVIGGSASIQELDEQVVEMEGISEVYSVAGRYDLVAVLRIPNNEALAELVTNKMLHVEGISDSETLIAFRVFSRHDLESMFSIGM